MEGLPVAVSRGDVPGATTMPYMYILECSDGTYYTGSTWSLQKRMEEHRDGMCARYIARRLPAKLVYFEEYERIDEAFNREKQVQRWSHAKKQALIDGKSGGLPELSRKKFKK